MENSPEKNYKVIRVDTEDNFESDLFNFLSSRSADFINSFNTNVNNICVNVLDSKLSELTDQQRDLKEKLSVVLEYIDSINELREDLRSTNRANK
jgi:hypothetical protein